MKKIFKFLVLVLFVILTAPKALKASSKHNDLNHRAQYFSITVMSEAGDIGGIGSSYCN